MVVVLLAGCGGDDGDASTAAPEGPVTDITITSTTTAFDIESFEVSVGEPVTVTYDNADDGVAHNIRVETGEDPEPATEVEVGPVVQELTFTLEEAGEYTYLCDVHPAMRGTITAT